MRLSVLIFVGFALILLLFSITTYVNYRQSQQVKENTEYVAFSQMVIRNATRLQRNFVEMESSLRGFLFTGDEVLLEPYTAAAQENNQLFQLLDESVAHADTVTQERKLNQIWTLYKRWEKEYAEPLIVSKKNAVLSDSANQQFTQLYRSQLRNNISKTVSDEIQASFREFTNQEYELRAVRRTRLDTSVTRTREISFALTTMSIILGLAIATYVAYLISRRIQKMVSLADTIAQGNYDITIEDSSRDELSRLARSLNSMARTLNENITELHRKNAELDRFAYVVSHDLKAPLRGIENVSTWMEEDFGDAMPPKVNEYLELMRGRICRMENLIDGILALSRVGKAKETVELVNVGTMVQEILEMLPPTNGLQIHVQPDMPTILTERIALQQVLSNLISNAIKYHDRSDGKVEITWKDNEQCYEFSVSDDGPGIDPLYHEKIFIVFQTLKERDAFESTGVGLAIVKKILDDKKCAIRVQSDVGQGSTFSFTWPK